MTVIPITLREANRFVTQHHRHHRQTQGAKFALGLTTDAGLIGVAICGRPTGRRLDTGLVLEVTRLCVLEGHPNACSRLYGACGKVARAMGYHKAVTFILASESGASLKAAGWTLEATGAGKVEWNSSVGQQRAAAVVDLFGTVRKYPAEKKQRWARHLITAKSGGHGADR